jgi:hypothetical protein
MKAGMDNLAITSWIPCGRAAMGCLPAAEHRRYGQNPMAISIYSHRCNPSRPACSRERPDGSLPPACRSYG